MARTDLTINAFARAGLPDPTPEAVAAADDAMFVNDGRTVVRVTNGAVGTAVIGFVTTAEVSALAIADQSDSLLVNLTEWYGPFETGLFNQASGDDTGKVYLDTDRAITVTAFRLP